MPREGRPTVAYAAATDGYASALRPALGPALGPMAGSIYDGAGGD